jgi:hypothetical protein
VQIRFLFLIIAYLIGLFAIVSGEADDSPGLQGLGLLLIISVTYWHFWRTRQR